MTGYVRKNKVPIDVMDITQLVQKSLADEDLSTHE